MQIDFSKPLLTLKGAELAEHGEPVRLGGVLCNIIAALPADACVPASERRKRFVLSVRITQAGGAIDVDEADTSLMVRLVKCERLAAAVLRADRLRAGRQGEPARGSPGRCGLSA